MYKLIHPAYIKHFKTDTISLEDLQASIGIDKKKALELVKDLKNKGSLVEEQSKNSIDLDINDDGKVNKKDFSKASKVLNKAKKAK